MAIDIKPANKGKLHQKLGVSKDSPIPTKKLDKALGSSNPKLKKEAVFAENAKKWHHGGHKQPETEDVKSDRGDFKIK